MNHRLIALLLLPTAPFASAEPRTYQVDPVHSSVAFKVRHFFTSVPGAFGDFTGTVVFDPQNLEKSRIEAQIQVKSIDTRNEERDAHLQTDDFFDAGGHPSLTFIGTRWEPTEEEGAYKVTGDLTMRGITRPVVLKVQFLGEGPGEKEGTFRSGWTAETVIDRTEWNVSYGQGVVGNRVSIRIDVSGIRGS